MTRLCLVRHGPTHEKVFTGWRDVPADLSDKPALAKLNAALPPAALVVSSDLIRAVATADAIQGKRRRLPHDPDLREINFGAWDGLHHTEVTAQDADLARQFWEQPGDLAPPNGESWNAVSARVSHAIDRLVAAHEGADLVVVAHFGAILTQVQRARNCTAYAALGQTIDNLSLTELEISNGQMQVVRVNHVC